MTEIAIIYEGNLSTRCVHSDNHSEIVTDAPKDNQGLGSHFSPTDLFAASLGSCMLTLMGIGAKKLHLDIQGTKAIVSKEMASMPLRRIGKLKIEISCPHVFSEEIAKKLMELADTCPVKKSLHPDIVIECSYKWG